MIFLLLNCIFSKNIQILHKYRDFGGEKLPEIEVQIVIDG